MSIRPTVREPVVITGIGMLASVGNDRETVWEAVRRGESRFHFLRDMRGIPDGEIVGATVDLGEPLRGRHKVLPLCERAADEAIHDANLDLAQIESRRFGCMISGHMGDLRWIDQDLGLKSGDTGDANWWEQWLPDTACTMIAGA